uniref:Starch-binding domain-containing protein 1 n=2 Tax=Pyxicephalus adspersus TaxID=30357 RepID=A0AAV3ALR1_PYXAD|nr:TPA: hypothetical protein GDO54_009055 [Pyxicephalus adspersus]
MEDMRPSFTKDEKLVVATEVCCSLGEDLKPSVVPDKVMSISAKTVDDLMQPVHVQDDGLIEMNGSEDHVQKENATASLQEDLTNGNLQNVSVSQLNRSANENIDQELQSSEQSELAGKNQSAAQVNGHISQMNNLTSESFHEEVSVPEKLEDAILTSHVSSTVDKCNVLSHSSNQEEERPDLKESDSGDNGCFVTQYDADSQRTKRVAAVQPIPQSVSLSFKVHYITHSNSQMIAVTGDHEKLGEWENFVPLTSDKDGYWSYTVTLPADANIEWKFVMVENGKIKRWEECNNRHLRTNHEDIAAQQWWGYP